ncbi:MAG: tetratricopeptide repeat protein [Thiotrichaceae bacterium]|nr:tetratricopeptide repeat protein [Thiotrichaceae bacterium]
MFKSLFLSGLLLVSSMAVYANDAAQQAVVQLQTKWAVAQYQTPKDKKESAFENLAKQAAEVTAKYPNQAEPLIWEAIINATYAGAKGGLGALGLVKKARNLLAQAEKIDPTAMQGSVYTSLGSLYYQVPGWPIGFGSNKKARKYLEKAIEVNPRGIDSNYFYGDFLRERGEYEKAIEVLQTALKAPPRPNRPVADAGRKSEIVTSLEKAKEKLAEQ